MAWKNGTHLNLFRHQLLITIISVSAVVVAMIGGSYAFFSSTSKAEEYNVLKVGELEVSYVDQGEGLGDILSLNGSYPMSDEDGKKLTPYRFNVVNTGTIDADYKIKIKNDEAIITEDKCENKLLDFKYIKYSFDNEDPALLSSKEKEDYAIYSYKNLKAAQNGEEGLLPNSSEIHEIRVWIDENAPNEVLGKHFHGKVVIESVQSGVEATILEFEVGESVTLNDGSKWHVLEDSGKGNMMVTLLSDYNLKEDGTYDSQCTGKACSPMAFDKEQNRLTESNPACKTPEYGCNYYAQNGSTVSKDSSIKTWLEQTYIPSLEKSLSEHQGNLEDLVVTLPTMEQLAAASNQKFDQVLLDFNGTPWIITTNYWTKTRSESGSSYVWSVVSENHNSFIQYANSSNTSGVRPVITIRKENVQQKGKSD